MRMMSTRAFPFRVFLLSLAFVCYGGFGFAQSAKTQKTLYKASQLFKIGNYDGALKLYLEAEGAGTLGPAMAYAVGVCYKYQKSVNEQVKGLPYLQRASEAYGKVRMPKEVFLHLGDLRMKNEEINVAMEAYERYAKLLDPDKERDKADKIQQVIMAAKTSAEVILNPKDIRIHRLDRIVNTEYTEYNPVVAADESVMAYTAWYPDAKSNSRKEQILVTTKDGGGDWSEPIKIDLKTNRTVGTAGISPDGQKMLIFMGKNNGKGGDLYFIEKDGDGWSSPTIIESLRTNSSLTTTGSITPDGKTIYFASDRPGGFGGLDVYRVDKKEDGRWGDPYNLGGMINTDKDEDAPFIHPDKKTLFFTSNRSASIGGDDIFKSILVRGRWRKPVNMGYPINTTADDNYFTLIADGSRAYFSSDRKGGSGEQDIYYFDMPESEANIPLTMVKGRILVGPDSIAVPTQIKVVDNETDQKVEFVYSPNKETGDYLIILPPGKNYDMIIESEGFMPYTVNINIPNQTYFYQLYQMIHLAQIKQFDVLVGQRVSVKNKFYDTGKDQVVVNVQKAKEASLVQSDSLDLYDMMDVIIKAEDTEAYEYLLDLMYSTAPTESVDFSDVEDDRMEIASRQYFFDESDTAHLEVRRVGEEVIYSLPTLFVTEESKKRFEKKHVRSQVNPELLKPVYSIYFQAGESVVQENYMGQLQVLLELLKNEKNLGVEISGYASAEGDREANEELSNKRAIEVLNFFNYRGVVRRRIRARGHGVTQSEDSSREKARRVEIKLVDLTNSNSVL
ncbi:hypothetical protein FUAX_16120 [Fulvitalea axinellae]|uniref:OmpA-like domain-containing protein n=1 Tax=Fulvitalea axinellae TaxID=1182444 RepID=A0AAU9DA58_9BACT|nr:hypothetical protein FUAX_16120 [Fulvitalea axinellae]